jgi:hypothetical protein
MTGPFVSQNKLWNALTLAICLALLTTWVYLPARQNDFLNWDDQSYVTGNDYVKGGLTWPGIAWAFSQSHSGNWHPITWLSHMLDCQFFGLNPSVHHLVNVLLHATNAALLLLLLHQLTGSLWRSGLVAALFALHPLRVESVAWLAERKDLLAALFGILTLMAYATYAFRSKVEGRRSKVWYGVTLGLFTCGLMSKPMLVTWPFVMLLLDFWPLRRIPTKDGRWEMKDGKTLRRLAVEKIPFFVLTAGSCVLTFFAQRAGGAVQSMEVMPMGIRLENAVVSYVRYLGMFFWPANLFPIYPHPTQFVWWQIAGALVILLAVTTAVWRMKSRLPAGLMGWSWYLGTLVPVIGIVQVGNQALADRYTYLPMIGIGIAVIWQVASWWPRNKTARQLSAVVMLGVVATLCLQTRHQLAHWKNTETLFRHVLQHYPNSVPALFGLGSHLVENGQLPEGRQKLDAVLKIEPDFAEALGTLAVSYDNEGNAELAVHYYQAALQRNPDHPTLLNNFAWLRAATPEARYRNGAEAVRLATKACELTGYAKPIFIGTLAAAQAEAGNQTVATANAERAALLAETLGLKEVAGRNLELLELYRSGKAAHGGMPTKL